MIEQFKLTLDLLQKVNLEHKEISQNEIMSG